MSDMLQVPTLQAMTTARRTLPLELTRDLEVSGWGTIPARSHLLVQLERRGPAGPGELSEGYALTADLYEPHGTWSGVARRRNGREADSGGCLHDVILAAAPGLAAFERVHLADLEGVPMHAAANAAYFLSGQSDLYELRQYGPEYVARHGAGLERACRTLRVESIPAACWTREGTRIVHAHGADHLVTLRDVVPAAWSAFLRELRELWWHEAHDAARLLEELPTLEELRGYDMRGQRCDPRDVPAGILARGVRVPR